MPPGLISCNAPEAQDPAYRSGHRSNNVTADAAGQVSVIAIRIGREQLLRPGRRLFGVVQRRQIALFDKRSEVGAQAVGQRHCQKRVAVSWIAASVALAKLRLDPSCCSNRARCCGSASYFFRAAKIESSS